MKTNEKNQTETLLHNQVLEYKKLILKKFKNGNYNSVYGTLNKTDFNRLLELGKILDDNNIIYMEKCLITYIKPFDYGLCYKCENKTKTQRTKYCEDCMK